VVIISGRHYFLSNQEVNGDFKYFNFENVTSATFHSKNLEAVSKTIFFFSVDLVRGSEVLPPRWLADGKRHERCL